MLYSRVNSELILRRFFLFENFVRCLVFELLREIANHGSNTRGRDDATRHQTWVLTRNDCYDQLDGFTYAHTH